MARERCWYCDGNCWYAVTTHHPDCDGDCGDGAPCPIQKQIACGYCMGLGYINTEDEEQ